MQSDRRNDRSDKQNKIKQQTAEQEENLLPRLSVITLCRFYTMAYMLANLKIKPSFKHRGKLLKFLGLVRKNDKNLRFYDLLMNRYRSLRMSSTNLTINLPSF